MTEESDRPSVTPPLPPAMTGHPRRVAIIHYWLVSMRGGEKVLEALTEIYPNADIYTHVVDRNALSEQLRSRRISTTFIARLPWAKKLYRHYLPFMPLALEGIDLRGYDLVISCEAGPSKGVITDPTAVHICYCHSPMRYIWDQRDAYLAGKNWITRSLFRLLSHRLRAWDVMSSHFVDQFVANSSFVAKRIEKYYRRDARVIPPPVDLSAFSIGAAPTKDYYLYFGQLTRYKRVDIAIEAFRRNGAKLVIAGRGEEAARLQAGAPHNVSFLGHLAQDEVASLLQNCRALIFPGEEDFGIVPLEAMACGRPVIAFGSGGALETVIDGRTGTLFAEQTADSLLAALHRFEGMETEFAPCQLRQHAQAFSLSAFKAEFVRVVAEAAVVIRS